MVEGVVCGAVGAGCWGLWRGCWAGVSGVPWGWVLGAAEGAIGGVVGVPQGEGAGGRGGGVWWGGTGRRGGGCWGLRWARWRRSAGAVGVGAGGRGEGGGGGQRGAVGVGAGSRGEAGRVRQTASINTPGPPPMYNGVRCMSFYSLTMGHDYTLQVPFSCGRYRSLFASTFSLTCKYRAHPVNKQITVPFSLHRTC